MRTEHIFMTYDGGIYNNYTGTYDPIDPVILQDPRVSDSIIFDTNRRTIYAQGLEFGKHHHTTSLDRCIGCICQEFVEKNKLYFRTVPKKVIYDEYAFLESSCRSIKGYYIDINDYLWGFEISLPRAINNENEFLTYQVTDNVEDIAIFQDHSVLVKKFKFTLTQFDSECYFMLSPGGELSHLIYRLGANFKECVYSRQSIDSVFCLSDDGQIITNHNDIIIKIKFDNPNPAFIEHIYVDRKGVLYVLVNTRRNDINIREVFVVRNPQSGRLDSLAEYVCHIDTYGNKTTLKNVYAGNDYVVAVFDDRTDIYYDNKKVLYIDAYVSDVKFSDFYDDFFINVLGNEFVFYVDTGNGEYLPSRDVTPPSYPCSSGIYYVRKNLSIDLIDNSISDELITSKGFKDIYIVINKYNGNMFLVDTSIDNNFDIMQLYETGIDAEIRNSKNIKVVFNGGLDTLSVIIDGHLYMYDSKLQRFININSTMFVSDVFFNTEQNVMFLGNSFDANDKCAIVGVNLDIEGNFTYQIADLSTNSGIFAYTYGLFYSAYGVPIITGISQTSFGHVSYTYTYMQTPNFSSYGVAKSDIQNHVITNVSLSPDGGLSYDYKALSATGTFVSTYQLSWGTTSPEFIYSLTQNPDGSITYSTRKLRTGATLSGDNVEGVVYNIKTDTKRTTISYYHKNLTTTSGNDDGINVLTNDSSYKFITNISQDPYGKISYSWMTMSSLFSNESSGDSFGVVTSANIDGTGKLSVAYKDLSTDSGVITPVISGDTGEHISTTPGTYSYFITGIAQDANGKISYTYSGVYTDPQNQYKWHEFSIDKRSSTDTNPQSNTVEVISTIGTSNAGNSKSHMMSYTTVSVATKKYVDTLMTANDALRYAGIVAPSSETNGVVAFTNTDYSTGAVYKVSGNGYFGEQYVTGGDMIISNSDSTTGASFTGWDVINNNIDLRTNDNVNSKNTNDVKKVITNVYLNDSGLFSYTSYNIGVQTTSTDDNGLNELLGGTFKVLNGVVLEQDGLDTRLSYTYTTIKVDKNHHSTVNNKTGGASKVIGSVNLSSDGKLSYSYTDIAKATYHYAPSFGTHTTGSSNTTITIPCDNSESTDKAIAYTSLTYDSKGHVKSSVKTPFTFKHASVGTTQSTSTYDLNITLGDTDALVVTSYSDITDTNGHLKTTVLTSYNIKVAHNTVETGGTNLGQKVITIAAGGINSDDLKSYTSLETSNGHLTSATYGSYVFKHGAPSGGTTYTIYTGSNQYIKTLSFTYDPNGHITSYSYTLATADFNDEKTKFVSYTTNKIYLGGTKTQAGNVTTNTYIDGTTYINNKQLYTDVSYVKQSYINGESYINSNRAWFNDQTYIACSNTAVTYINDSRIYSNNKSLVVSGDTSSSYLLTKYTYLGKNDFSSELYVRSGSSYFKKNAYFDSAAYFMKSSNSYAYINANRISIDRQTYFADGSYFNSDKLHINKVAYISSSTYTSYITPEHMMVNGVQSVVSSDKMYLNSSSTYIGTSDGSSLAYVRTKHIDLYNESPIEFNNLKALWGVVHYPRPGGGQLPFPNDYD